MHLHTDLDKKRQQLVVVVAQAVAAGWKSIGDRSNSSSSGISESRFNRSNSTRGSSSTKSSNSSRSSSGNSKMVRCLAEAAMIIRGGLRRRTAAVIGGYRRGRGMQLWG